MRCPKCGAVCPPDFRFCEVDGTSLLATDGLAESGGGGSGPRMLCKCGAALAARDESGFCQDCGHIWQPSENHHVEQEISRSFAAATDRGIKHLNNEDAFAIKKLEHKGMAFYIMVVCDGLSSAEGASMASTVAADTTAGSLAQMIASDAPNPGQCVVKAIEQAHAAVCNLHIDPTDDKDAPGTTIVAAVAWKGHAVIGWVGDSRAYLFSREGGRLLTRDHSWVNEVVDSGLMTESQAQRSGNTHVITRCLGPSENLDATIPPEVPVVETVLPDRCRFVLCSDGLWNYASNPGHLATLMDEAPSSATALGYAKTLIDSAIKMGGHDNITVAICDIS